MRKEDLAKVARTYGTPTYVFDLDEFQKRIGKIHTHLGEKIQLCYAMKANPFLIQAAESVLERLEVCSPGEYAICKRNRIPVEKLVLSGVYKAEEDLEEILDSYGAEGIHTIESLQQYEILTKLAKERKIKIKVLLRLTSGNQFGLDENVLKEIVAHREEHPYVQILGIQYYSGTQKKKTEVLCQEIQRLDQLLHELKDAYGYEAEELEYGPGLYVAYFQKEEDKGYEDLQPLKDALEKMQFQGLITLEMGRYMAASCGNYLTRVVDEKKNAGVHYAIVDGGIHHLNYFGQMMAMKLPYYRQLDGTSLEEKYGDDAQAVTVCGSLCTVSDVLVKNMPLQGEIMKDILVFENTGAYSITEGIYLFLSRNLPKVVFRSEENGLELVRDMIESNLLNGV